MKIVLVIILSFAISFCFSQTKNKSNGTSQPTMEETAKWLMDKYNSINSYDTSSGNNQLVTVREGKQSLKGGYYYAYSKINIENQFLVVDERIILDTHFFYESKWTIDLSKVDSIKFINGETSEDAYYKSTYWGFEFKSTYEFIEEKRGDGSDFKWSFYTLPPLALREENINQRYLKALKYYSQLCRKKYPPKKDLF